jgi:DNA-directed RNA polymerase subunit RPC12/RpoP
MLVGKCTRCGKQYVGWALSRPEHQECNDCGAKLVIRNIRNIGNNYQSDNKTLASSLRSGKEEWQEALENTLPHFLL